MKKLVILSVLVLSFTNAKSQVIWSKKSIGGSNLGTIELDTNWLSPIYTVTQSREVDNSVWVNGGYFGSYKTTIFPSINFNKEDLILALQNGIEKLEQTQGMYNFEIGQTDKGIVFTKSEAKSALRALNQ